MLLECWSGSTDAQQNTKIYSDGMCPSSQNQHLDGQLLGQTNFYLYSFLETSLFMVSAERTDRVNNLVHFADGLAVHGSIESVEVLADSIIVKAVGLGIDIEQDLQEGFITLGIGLLTGYVSLQGGDKGLHIHQNHQPFFLLSFWMSQCPRCRPSW